MPGDQHGLTAKTRDIHNHHMDSTVWDGFRFRDDDVVIATYAKSGTTWMQQIVGQLIFAGQPDVPVSQLSPWVDLRVPPKEEKLAELEAQTHRRFVKTHLPVDALVFSPKASYIYIGRDGRDVVWSMFNHHHAGNDLWYELLNDTPGRIGPPLEPPVDDPVQYFRDWLARDGYPFWPFWENMQSWWAVRDLPNVKLVHFQDLKSDLEREMRGIAEFLDIDLPEEIWPRAVRHCTFAYMKDHADAVSPLGGAVFESGGQSFIHKGRNGRWRDRLGAAEIEEYEARARAELGEDCAAWLANGSRLT